MDDPNEKKTDWTKFRIEIRMKQNGERVAVAVLKEKVSIPENFQPYYATV